MEIAALVLMHLETGGFIHAFASPLSSFLMLLAGDALVHMQGDH